MKSFLKKVITYIIGTRRLIFLFDFKSLINNFIADFNLYFRHSTVFWLNNSSKIESKIILNYHSIEKGLLFSNPRPRFAKEKVINLHNYLQNKSYLKDNSQTLVAYQIMCQYFEYHRNINAGIEDFYTVKQYEAYKEIVASKYSVDFNGALPYTRADFYKFTNSNFFDFSNSRKSVRNFTGEKVDVNLIKESIQLALNAPSVCNRQASKVYLIEEKELLDKVLIVQGGLNDYLDKISQLLIVTSDRNYFFSVGERNQLYIDGGIFLMNLLYSLHFYKIANCSANWGKTIRDEKMLKSYITIPESEKIICMIAIGISTDDFKVCLSKRRDIDEVFHLIKS